MSETTTSQSHAPQHASHEPPRRRHWLLAAGWPRAAWMTVLLLPARDGDRRRAPRARRLRAGARLAPGDRRRRATMAPLGFLSGLGAFDYWVSYAIGRPTQPEDHSEPRRLQLEGLLPRQHRSQGDRDPVPHDDDLLLPRRRAARAARARRARAARDELLRHADVQRAVHRPRVADDLPVHHPGVRRARELRRPADARRARHGVPAAQRAVVLAAPDRRDHAAHVVLLPGRPAQAGRTTRRSPSTSRSATSSSRWRSSGPVRARS